MQKQMKMLLGAGVSLVVFVERASPLVMDRRLASLLILKESP
jgi:hypothetical protein